MKLSRRDALERWFVVASGMLVWPTRGQASAQGAAANVSERLAALERRHGGRLGVAMLDTGSGRHIEQRADERFAMCSTFKLLAAGYVLRRVDRGQERMDRRIVFDKDVLVSYSPVTEMHVGPPGMTVSELCAAAITMSDNTAGNLLLESFGGPPALTGFARSLGDRVTRLDRNETSLNEAIPGDPRDTTTPRAMLENLRRLVLGDALSSTSREQLTMWLVGNKTGNARLRAGLPRDWRTGDKTGTGANGSANDIALTWPPRRSPMLCAVYYAESSATADQQNAVIAEVARIVSARAI